MPISCSEILTAIADPKPQSTTTMSSTGLITLRPYELSDADEFINWARDENVFLYSRIRRHYCFSREEAVEYLARHAIPHPWYRAICLDGRPIGFVCLAQGTEVHRCRGMISYALGTGYCGRGIATAAVKMAVVRVFEELPEVGRVEAYVEEENGASQRVLQKAGFSKEGVMRKYLIINGKVVDVVLYSRLSIDPIVSS